MDTNEIRNELSHGKVNNMFSQVIEMLEDLNNKQPSTIEVDLTPITEKLNSILNRLETKDFTAEQQKYFSNWFKLLLAEIATKAPNNSKINEIETIVKKLSELEQTKTVINEHHFKIDFQNTKAVTTMIVMGLVVVLLSSALYIANQPNYDRMDNDLKYRYLKMKGGASPKRISELENLFEINRDNTKIRQMLKDVEHYEQAVKKRVTLEEQARLRQLEAERLTHEAESLKNK